MKRSLIFFLAFVFFLTLGMVIYISQNTNTATYVSSQTINGPLVENGIILFVRCNEHKTRDKIDENHVCHRETKNIMKYLSKNIGYKNIIGVYNNYVDPDFLKKAAESLKSSKEIKRMIVVPMFFYYPEFANLQDIKKGVIEIDKIFLANLANDINIPIFYNDAGFRLGEDKEELILTRIKECLDKAEKKSPTPPCELSGG